MSLETRPDLGLTLIELMVALALLGILGALAMPGLRALVANATLSSASSDLMTSLAQARSQAVRLGQRVVVCRAATATACSTGTGTWGEGWLQFVDTDHDGQVSAGESVLAYQAGRPSLRIEGNANVARAVFFKADGSAGMAGTLQVCSPAEQLTDARRARRLVITLAGRVVSTRPALPPTCPTP